MTSFAEQKKQILPYLQRADEIQSLDPKVAYYCRYYAIKQGIQIEDKHPDINGVLEALMSKLEQDNKKLTLSDTDKDHCEAFAINVFNRADKQDRSGKADHNTVKAFYVASVFIEILRQFGELSPDMVERQQYAGWKAADIRKALREGRTPTPGPAVKKELDLDLPDIPGSTSMNRQTTGQSRDLDLPTPPSNMASGFNNLPPVSGARDPGPPGGFAGIQGPNAGPPGGFAGAQGPYVGPPGGFPGAQGPPGGFPGSAPQRSQPVLALPPHKFMPGNKVYYNAYDGTLLKGTVASYIEDSSDASYQVALSAKVIDIKEERLAHDFSPGDQVLLIKPDGSLSEATVTNLDATRWPVAYLLTLSNGAREPAVAASLSPLIFEKPAEPDTLSQVSGFGAPAAGPHDGPPGPQFRPPGPHDGPPGPQFRPQGSSQPGPSESNSQARDADLGAQRSVSPPGTLPSGPGQPSDQNDSDRYPGIDHQGPASTIPTHGREDPNHAFPNIDYHSQHPGGFSADDHSGFDGNRTGPNDFQMDDTATRSQGSIPNQQRPPFAGPNGFHGAGDPTNQDSGPAQNPSFNGYESQGSPVRQSPGPSTFQPPPAGPSIPGTSQNLGFGLSGVTGLQGRPQQGGSQPDTFQPSSAASQAASRPPPPGQEPPSSSLQGPRVSYNPSMHAINDAHKVTKTALSALSFEDVPTALKYLNKAIELLTVPGAQK